MRDAGSFEHKPLAYKEGVWFTVSLSTHPHAVPNLEQDEKGVAVILIDLKHEDGRDASTRAPVAIPIIMQEDQNAETNRGSQHTLSSQ